jgi:hypothetical protein
MLQNCCVKKPILFLHYGKEVNITKIEYDILASKNAVEQYC